MSGARRFWRNTRELLNFSFLEHNMLAHDWIVFAHLHLFGRITWVFLGDVEKTSIRRAHKTNLNSGRLRHNLGIPIKF